MLQEYKFLDIKDYRKLKFLGKGTFSNVFRIQEKATGNIFAAKILQDFYGDEEGKAQKLIERMKIESSSYSRLNFPSITKFYGVCSRDFEDEPYPSLILEYIPNGTLNDLFAKSSKGEPLPPEWNSTKVLINIYGIAAGMSYLHSKDVLYRDLKLLNILEDENYYPKMTDFGVSKIILDINQDNSIGVGSPLYMAPEILNGDQKYTKSIDVYSFAICVYQLIAKTNPFSYLKGNMTPQRFMAMIKKGDRSKFNANVPKCYQELITKCWSQDPENRPTFPQIVEMLKTNREFVTELNVDEEEFHEYIDIIEGRKPYPTSDIRQQKEEEIVEEDEKPLIIHDAKPFDLESVEQTKVIGEGSFGVVYEVRDKETNSVYAAKVSKGEIYECLKSDNQTVN